MNHQELFQFIRFLEKRSKELCPDYPGIKNDTLMSPYEHLWAITTSLEGVRLANDETHRIIKYLTSELGWDYTKMIEQCKAAGVINS